MGASTPTCQPGPSPSPTAPRNCSQEAWRSLSDMPSRSAGKRAVCQLSTRPAQGLRDGRFQAAVAGSAGEGRLRSGLSSSGRAVGLQSCSGWSQAGLSSSCITWEGGAEWDSRGWARNESGRWCKPARDPQNLVRAVGALPSVLETHTRTLVPKAFIQPRRAGFEDQEQQHFLASPPPALASSWGGGRAALTPGTPGCRTPGGSC